MNPTPMPPKMQLSHMPLSGVNPASGLRLSCMQLTEPLLVQVVIAAHVGPADGPKRISLPSRLPVGDSTGRPVSTGFGRIVSVAMPQHRNVARNTIITAKITAA